MLHDWFDEEIWFRNSNNHKTNANSMDFDDNPLTIWHNDFEGGFLFASSSVFPTIKDEYIQVETVVCIDLPGKHKQQLIDLVNNINEGWLPSKRA